MLRKSDEFGLLFCMGSKEAGASPARTVISFLFILAKKALLRYLT
jgi:hypothetical protein